MRYLLPVLSAAFALASAQSRMSPLPAKEAIKLTSPSKENITINPGTVDPGTRGMGPQDSNALAGLTAG